MKIRKKSLLGFLAGSVALGALGSTQMACAADNGPILIGVIGEESAVAGASISKSAQLAADDINKAGGVNGRQIKLVTYDDHSSAADGVRAFQRAVKQDHVVAVVGSYISEIALAIEPWAARLKTPFITPGAASTDITKHVHDDYAHNKYTFHGYVNSAFLADAICDFSKEQLVGKFHMKSTVIMSEDAAWTTPLDAEFEKCLPKAGLKVVDHIRFNPDTTDFTPIFNKIEDDHPDVITTGISHVGVQPTVQWHDQQVPVAMSGQSSQATTSTFWKDTNGAASGVLTYSAGDPDIALSPKTVPFGQEYIKKYNSTPAYDGYASYDAILVLADAIKRAGSTDADKMVAAMEKTDLVGTQGRIKFYGKDSPYTHGLEYGPGLVTGLFIQWQNGKQVAVWPSSVAKANIVFPSFVKTPSAN